MREEIIESSNPEKKTQHRPMQKPRTAQSSNPENTSKPTKKKRKKKKPRTSTQKTLTDPENTNPQQKIFQDGRWRENKK